MEDLHWPLSVLSRCIYYKNISGAAQNIGLSQPQISRLIKKLEDELDLVLLDRSSPRHSKWTKEAWKLVEIYGRNTRSLEHSLNQLKQLSIPTVLTLGALEGLIPQALSFIDKIEKKLNIKEIHLDVYDQNEMESHFLLGELDLIFTSRIPGKNKPKHIKIIGHQSLEQYKEKGLEVLSPFEFKTRLTNKNKKLVSNSLRVRSLWLKKYGGKGQLPSPVKEKKDINDLDVLMLAKDSIHPSVWNL